MTGVLPIQLPRLLGTYRNTHIIESVIDATKNVPAATETYVCTYEPTNLRTYCTVHTYFLG